MNNHPIGIFDSGVGGLTVWQELIRVLPGESFYYFADSAFCPYGSKPQQEIIDRSRSIVDFLLSKQCKLIVVACNSASAAAIDFLREHYTVPFVAMEPAVKQAAQNTVTGHIGILATELTFNGRLYSETSKKFANGLDVFVQVGHGLVELIESGEMDTLRTEQLVREYIEPMIARNVDQIVLGCTHYPFLIDMIRTFLPEHITLINPAFAVARQVKNILEQNALASAMESGPSYQFYTSGDPSTLRRFLDSIITSPYTIFANS